MPWKAFVQWLDDEVTTDYRRNSKHCRGEKSKKKRKLGMKEEGAAAEEAVQRDIHIPHHHTQKCPALDGRGVRMTEHEIWYGFEKAGYRRGCGGHLDRCSLTWRHSYYANQTHHHRCWCWSPHRPRIGPLRRQAGVPCSLWRESCSFHHWGLTWSSAL